MELFFDGGLFELLIVIGFGYLINFIFLKRYLLIFFSSISIAFPILLLFINHGEFYYYMVGLCIFNSLLLTILLWQKRLELPDKALFDIQKFRNKFLNKKKVTPH